MNKIIVIFITILNLFLVNEIVPWAHKDNAIAGEILDNGVKLYSQYNEELIIRDFFNDRSNGVFLDVGCADYKDMSTTYYLEQHLGWAGIAVDALAEYADAYLKYRPKTRFFRFIVTDHSANNEPFFALLNAKALSSANVRFLKASVKYHHIQSPNIKQQEAPAITLDALLDQNGVSKIDFLSMDIEGGEPEALAGFNIKKFRPELVCIEHARRTSKKILDYFQKYGYERIDKYLPYDPLNWYFSPKQ